MATANASLRKADQTKGGGPRQATITDIRFVDDFNYGGKQDKDSAALYVEFEIDGFKKPWDANMTVGPAEAWELVDDGDAIKRSNGKDGGLNESSNAGRFMGALCDAIEAQGLDFDEVLPDNTVRALRGARVTVEKLEYQTVGGDDKDMFVIESIVELGGTSSKKGAKDKSKMGSVKGGPSVEEKTEAAILELLEEKSPIKKGDLPTLVSSAVKKDPDAKAITQLAFKDSFVFAEDRPWDSDKKKGTLKKREDDDE